MEGGAGTRFAEPRLRREMGKHPRNCTPFLGRARPSSPPENRLQIGVLFFVKFFSGTADAVNSDCIWRLSNRSYDRSPEGKSGRNASGQLAMLAEWRCWRSGDAGGVAMLAEGHFLRGITVSGLVKGLCETAVV